MGSTHPPLESLLTFSQNCLEGFEHSRLNLISNIRKEIHQALDEWVESEVDARFARWILESRQAGEVHSLSDPTAEAKLFPREFALRSVADGVGGLVSGSDQVLASEFPCQPTLEIHDAPALELQSRLRRATVSQDASAALRSLEHSASCKARSIGEHSIDLLNYRDPRTAHTCLYLPFPEREALQVSSGVAPPISYLSCSTNESEPFELRHAVAPASERGALFAWSALESLACFHPRTAAALGRYSFVVGFGQGDLHPLRPDGASLPKFPLRRAAVFLRN
jgi:hypothetical protein